jgi:hypothetical protein
MNKVEIRVFPDTIMVWVKNNRGQMLESIPFISDKQVNEVCRDYSAYVDLDEREE